MKKHPFSKYDAREGGLSQKDSHKRIIAHSACPPKGVSTHKK